MTQPQIKLAKPAVALSDDIEREMAIALKGNVAQEEHGVPGYGAPQRDAVKSVVDSIARDICTEIDELALTLDDIRKRVLENAAAAKHKLEEHVGICVAVKDEVAHIRRVIADIKGRAEEA